MLDAAENFAYAIQADPSGGHFAQPLDQPTLEAFKALQARVLDVWRAEGSPPNVQVSKDGAPDGALGGLTTAAVYLVLTAGPIQAFRTGTQAFLTRVLASNDTDQVTALVANYDDVMSDLHDDLVRLQPPASAKPAGGGGHSPAAVLIGTIGGAVTLGGAVALIARSKKGPK